MPIGSTTYVVSWLACSWGLSDSQSSGLDLKDNQYCPWELGARSPGMGDVWSKLNLHGSLNVPQSLGRSWHGKKQNLKNDGLNSLFH